MKTQNSGVKVKSGVKARRSDANAINNGKKEWHKSEKK
jgi:hypothetical protein